jgi:hypothetical protein
MTEVDDTVRALLSIIIINYLWRALLLWNIPPHTTGENDQYERIRRLRLIVYHHNLHTWYMLVCIGGMGGIGVLLKVLSRWHKQNIWFVHFNCFFISIWWYDQFFNFKRNFSFQISKVNIFKFKNEKKISFFISNFRDIFQFFQISKSFFSIISISSSHFFKIQKQKILIQI